MMRKMDMDKGKTVWIVEYRHTHDSSIMNHKEGYKATKVYSSRNDAIDAAVLWMTRKAKEWSESYLNPDEGPLLPTDDETMKEYMKMESRYMGMLDKASKEDDSRTRYHKTKKISSRLWTERENFIGCDHGYRYNTFIKRRIAH